MPSVTFWVIHTVRWPSAWGFCLSLPFVSETGTKPAVRGLACWFWEADAFSTGTLGAFQKGQF